MSEFESFDDDAKIEDASMASSWLLDVLKPVEFSSSGESMSLQGGGSGSGSYTCYSDGDEGSVGVDDGTNGMSFESTLGDSKSYTDDEGDVVEDDITMNEEGTFVEVSTLATIMNSSIANNPSSTSSGTNNSYYSKAESYYSKYTKQSKAAFSNRTEHKIKGLTKDQMKNLKFQIMTATRANAVLNGAVNAGGGSKAKSSVVAASHPSSVSKHSSAGATNPANSEEECQMPSIPKTLQAASERHTPSPMTLNSTVSRSAPSPMTLHVTTRSHTSSPKNNKKSNNNNNNNNNNNCSSNSNVAATPLERHSSTNTSISVLRDMTMSLMGAAAPPPPPQSKTSINGGNSTITAAKKEPVDCTVSMGGINSKLDSSSNPFAALTASLDSSAIAAAATTAQSDGHKSQKTKATNKTDDVLAADSAEKVTTHEDATRENKILKVSFSCDRLIHGLCIIYLIFAKTF